ncbi:MAG: hypothetical protein WAT10_03145, partial [Enterococcus aquimarinus]
EIFFGESVQSYSSKTVQFSLALTIIQKSRKFILFAERRILDEYCKWIEPPVRRNERKRRITEYLYAK